MKSNLIPLVLIGLILISCGKLSNHSQADGLQESNVAQVYKDTTSPKIDHRTVWVDSIYANMGLNEKIGQLFMVAAYSNRNQDHVDTIQKLIEKQHIGGVIFFQGGPVRQARLTNLYQSKAKVPLLVGIDGEWGLNMRLDSTARYPYNMTLGAIKDNTIIKQIGEQMGADCNRMGIHINFAPSVDVNINSKNPVIGVRSFGENKINVTEKAWAYVEGIQSTGILTTAKHFPGHGDTDTDSHFALPVIPFSEQRIDSVELYPYKELIRKGVTGVMVAHLNVPSYESNSKKPSSLSYTIITELLKEKLGFEGLIYTDALNMKGAANFGKQTGDVDVLAFKAGNDVLLFTENAPRAISKIIEAYNNNEITEARLAHSVKKILRAKYDVGLNHYTPIKIDHLVEDLNQESRAKLYKTAIENAITVVKNTDNLLPLSSSTKNKIAFIKLGDGIGTSFLEDLKAIGPMTDLSNLSRERLLKELSNHEQVLISYHRKNWRLTTPISNTDKQLIETIAQNNKVILTVFASQYSLVSTNLKDVESVVISYENTMAAQKSTANILFGKQQAQGHLPASISTIYPVNTGIRLGN